MNKDSHTAAILSRMAYEDNDPGTNLFLRTRGLKYIGHYDIIETDTQFIIYREDSRLWIAFRGTEATKIKDWMTDLDSSQEMTEAGYVHQGMWRAMKSAWVNKIQKAITNHREEYKGEIGIVGHSLGGGLANLMAFLMCCLLPEIENHVMVYTFGAPRVFSKGAAANFKRSVQHSEQWQHWLDPVPKLPRRYKLIWKNWRPRIQRTKERYVPAPEATKQYKPLWMFPLNAHKIENYEIIAMSG